MNQNASVANHNISSADHVAHGRDLPGRGNFGRREQVRLTRQMTHELIFSEKAALGTLLICSCGVLFNAWPESLNFSDPAPRMKSFLEAAFTTLLLFSLQIVTVMMCIRILKNRRKAEWAEAMRLSRLRHFGSIQHTTKEKLIARAIPVLWFIQLTLLCLVAGHPLNRRTETVADVVARIVFFMPYAVLGFWSLASEMLQFILRTRPTASKDRRPAVTLPLLCAVGISVKIALVSAILILLDKPGWIPALLGCAVILTTPRLIFDAFHLEYVWLTNPDRKLAQTTQAFS